jgi:electron transport complex protein RnfB
VTATALPPTTVAAAEPAAVSVAITATRALAEALNDALPQTQCTRCGYPDCHSYAVAMAAGEVDINRCPPGGAEGIQRLAALTGRPVRALDPAHGSEGPRAVALIDEDWCIGCTLCIKACPVDCIVGASKVMHTIIGAQCTGCELCVPVCPVDCIAMVPVTTPKTGWDAWTAPQAAEARDRYAFHRIRIERDGRENDERLAGKAQAKLADLASHSLHTDPDTLAAKRAVIEAALQRAAARKAADAQATADTPTAAPAKDRDEA